MTGQDTPINKEQVVSKEALENLEKQIHFRTTQLLEANRQLKQEINDRKRAEQITRTLFRISNAVSTTKDLGELYSSIHSILGKVIDLTNFYIAIYYKEAKRVSFPYFVDQFDSGDVYADRFSTENSLTGTVITTQKPLFLNKSELQQRGEENRVMGTVPITWVGVPLKIKEEVIGIMATQSYEELKSFDVLDLDVLISVSDQVALAIERKRNEQALVASEKRYRNIIETIEDGYYETDLHGNLTLVNQAMCKILGYKASELLGLNTALYMSEQTVRKLSDSLADVLSTELPGRMVELEICRKNGNTRYVETVISATREDDDQLTGFRGIARDITQRKSDEKSRRTFEEHLQQSQRLESLGTLAGGIAHDFNNLLMGIQGRTALILNDLSKAHPHFESLTSIEECVESAASLTTRLLGFARGGMYEVQPVNLNSLVEKSIQMFGRTRKEVTITTAFKSNLWPVEVDSRQIEQVLVNLLVNAGQAMPEGGSIAIATSQVLVGADDAGYYGIQPGNYAQLTLADTGKGIDKDTMRKIFDPFFTTKAIGHGTGLGLAMVYGIIRNHSGAISVKSELNKGTIFTILLPAIDKNISTVTVTHPTVEQGSETILLVDDEQIIIDVCLAILTMLGYDVMTATSGQEAIEIYTENQDRIDLLIIDMIMPRMGGGELFDRLKRINPDVNVLLSSGYSIEGQAHEILKRGCKGFIQKPFNISLLSDKIRKTLTPVNGK
jgi:two-component system cell cycle sensor histidine kinase/response regulator CckA